MFRPIPMKRLRVVVLGRDAELVLRNLGQLGVMQLSRSLAREPSWPVQPSDRAQQLARCDRLLGQVRDACNVLGLATLPEQVPPEFSWSEVEQQFDDWRVRTNALVEQSEKLESRLDELQGITALLRAYRSLDLPLGGPTASPFLHVVTGTLPAGNLAEADLLPGSLIVPLTIEAGRQHVVVLALPRCRPELDKALRSAGFQEQSLPSVEGATSGGLFSESERGSAAIVAELQKLTDEKQALASAARGSLASLREWLIRQRRLLEAQQCLSHTDASVVMAGWIPASAENVVRERLETTTHSMCLIEIKAAEELPDAEVPVILRHCAWLKPFELLVRAYGLPRYGELAPTAFLALSYVFMFGMMFGDVGQGAVLVGLGLFLWSLCQKATWRDAGLLLIFNGLASVAFGLAYGSYFGLPQLKTRALWHDPLEGNPMELMLLAISAGIVVLSAGVVLNIINRFARREIVEGCFSKFGVAGVVFYWGALFIGARWILGQGLKGWSWVAALVLGGPLLCWACAEPMRLWWHPQVTRDETPNALLTAGIESCVGTFEGVLLFLANTVSFVRLGAYAMSHAALLLATFTVADQVRGLAMVGSSLAVLVIVLGNLVALLMEGIVAGVQALRLEYYEFFGKFFSGDGQPFVPFSLSGEGAT